MSFLRWSPETLQAIFPNTTSASIARFFAPLSEGMRGHSIDTPLRQAHFLAQVAQESGELRYTEEIASGAAYEGRVDLENVHSGDGVRFKGRGLLQITGRANYAAFGLSVGRDLIAEGCSQSVASDAGLAAESAAWFWDMHGLNRFADADDLVSITRRINGGLNGLASRQRYLDRAKALLLPAHEMVLPNLKAVAESACEAVYTL